MGRKKEIFLIQLTIVVVRSEVEGKTEVMEVDMISEVGEELREVEFIPDVGEDL